MKGEWKEKILEERVLSKVLLENTEGFGKAERRIREENEEVEQTVGERHALRPPGRIFKVEEGVN